MPKNNMGILMFIYLLNEVADVEHNAMTPKDFAARSHQAYQELLKGLEQEVQSLSTL